VGSTYAELEEESGKFSTNSTYLKTRSEFANRWPGRVLPPRHELFADELKHPERHISIAPDLQPTEEDLATATDTLGWFEEDVSRADFMVAAGTRVFRVRLGYREENYRTVPIPILEMGAPPVACVTRPGRANGVGVSYFYGAEEERTAVAEVRPHRGTLVSIGEGETLRDLKFLDLTAGIALASPFQCPEGYLRSRVESSELFNHLDREFAKPLRHADDNRSSRQIPACSFNHLPRLWK
jgi:RES domain